MDNLIKQQILDNAKQPEQIKKDTRKTLPFERTMKGREVKDLTQTPLQSIKEFTDPLWYIKARQKALPQTHDLIIEDEDLQNTRIDLIMREMCEYAPYHTETLLMEWRGMPIIYPHINPDGCATQKSMLAQLTSFFGKRMALDIIPHLWVRDAYICIPIKPEIIPILSVVYKVPGYNEGRTLINK